MKQFFIIVLVVMSYVFAKAETNTSAFFQKYVSHQVKKGETLSSIAKNYGLTERDITSLNPDAKDTIYEGLVLILPARAAQNDSVEQDDLKFKTHKVRRKETLYSISKKYKVPQEVIKKYNKRLYSQVLRKGDKIQVPTNYVGNGREVVSNENSNAQNEAQNGTSGMMIHNVLAKETKYGIARMYGLTIAELEKLNPFIKTGLQEGVELSVPQRSEANSAIIDADKYAFYEVKKGNTMYSLLRELEIEADELMMLNPSLENGLKEGMILKVPKNSAGSIAVNDEFLDVNTINISESKKGSLLDSLSDFSTKRVVIMLPFGLDRVNNNTTESNEDLLRDDRVLRLSLDLYSGMLMAAEDAKNNGISSELTSYDTAYNGKDGAATNARKIDDIINRNDFTAVDAVIGPLLGANINRTATLLGSKNIPIISPMSSNVNTGNNIFISRPDNNLLRAAMLSYVRENGVGKNIVIIADEKNQATQSKIVELFPNAVIIAPRTGDNGYFLYPDDIPSKIDPVLENWVFLETNDVPLISTVTTSLNAETGLKKVTLFTTNRGNAYDSDEIQHIHLKNLSFHFPSVDREYDYSIEKKFIDRYQDRYGISPSNYAIRGYDLMYDTLLRLSYGGDLYTAAATGIETGYIENKFRYGNRNMGGFSNDAIFLMKYTDDLTLEEVSFTKD